jgi:hypothetical protein
VSGVCVCVGVGGGGEGLGRETTSTRKYEVRPGQSRLEGGEAGEEGGSGSGHVCRWCVLRGLKACVLVVSTAGCVPRALASGRSILSVLVHRAVPVPHPGWRHSV